MDWQEVNCIIDGLKMLVAQHKATLGDTSVDDDMRADTTNDLAYTEILLHKYEAMRDTIAAR